MTEYEKFMVVAENHGLALMTITIFISIVTGYLITAYKVGAELSKTQVWFLSFIFVIFSVFTIWGSVVYFSVGDRIVSSMTAEASQISISPTHVVGILETIILAGCLFFMRNIRRKI